MSVEDQTRFIKTIFVDFFQGVERTVIFLVGQIFAKFL